MINYCKASFKYLFVLSHLFTVINLRSADDQTSTEPKFSWKRCLLLNLGGCIAGPAYLSKRFLTDVRSQNHAAAKEVTEKSKELALKAYDKAIESPGVASASVGLASIGLILASDRSQSRTSAVAGVMAGSTTYLHLKRRKLELQDAKIAAAKQEESDRLAALNIVVSELETKKDEVLARAVHNYDLAAKTATGAEGLYAASVSQADQLASLQETHDMLGGIISDSFVAAESLSKSTDNLSRSVDRLGFLLANKN